MSLQIIYVACNFNVVGLPGYVSNSLPHAKSSNSKVVCGENLFPTQFLVRCNRFRGGKNVQQSVQHFVLRETMLHIIYLIYLHFSSIASSIGALRALHRKIRRRIRYSEPEPVRESLLGQAMYFSRTRMLLEFLL